MAALVPFLCLVFVYGLVSRRLERTIVTGPILFAVAGVIGFLALPGMRGKTELSTFRLAAEIGLVLLLFTDASRTDLRLLKSIRQWPVRLLSFGLLLTILVGTVAAKLLFPSLSLAEAGILGAILAPTDAGLGQVIVSSPRVPERIREALNVEAGLNDGLSVPFFLFFIALAAPHGSREASLVQFILQQLGYGVLVGAGIGLVGGKLLDLAHKRQWVKASARRLGVVTLPLLAMILSEEVGASMFIAAFVAGLTVQVPYRNAGKHSVEFAEEWGQLLNDTVFFLFGAIFASVVPLLTPAVVLYAVLSLTVVRILPVWIALLGARLTRATVLFMGWFGPRGLASIVLGLVFLEHEVKVPGEQTIVLAVVATVFLSILAHGASAAPGISLYLRSIRALPETAPEHEGRVG